MAIRSGTLDPMAAALDPDSLYHLVTPAERERYEQEGSIEPPSLVSEGFVHCSWGRQVMGTVGRHFVGVPEVVALELDPAAVAEHLVEEDSTGSGQAFPHVYAPIPTSAVLGAVALPVS